MSRSERFDEIERAALKPLPTADFDDAEWEGRQAPPPDGYVVVEATNYSAPHIRRGKRLRVRLTLNQVELFLNGERLAVHPRDRSRSERLVRIDAHFPFNSLAYYEATPQQLLSQSRFIHSDSHQLVVDLFNADVYGHLRRAQGLLRSATKHLHAVGHDLATPRIVSAIAPEMRRVDRARVPLFVELRTRRTPLSPVVEGERDIVRRPGNPLLRYAAAGHPVPSAQEALL